MRRASIFHQSLHRPRTVMGADPLGFYLTAFLASFLFASKAYLALPAALLVFLLVRWLTKKDPLYAHIFQRYLDERHVYTSLPQPRHWRRRSEGWGRGLPW
jgi:type IV secretory pathway TrbD component